MICPECNEQKGCACNWQTIPERPHKVCPACAERIKTEALRNDPTTRIIQANSVPIFQRDQQTSETEQVRGKDLQSKHESESN